MRRTLLAGIGAGFALLAGAGSCGTSTPKASSPAQTVATLAPVSTHATTATTARPAAAPATLLDTTGTGSKTTDPFTAKGAWHLKYSYDCANFGTAGNFAVEVSGGDGFTDQGPNTQGMSGADSNYEPAGGTYTLNVVSECKWHVVVTG